VVAAVVVPVVVLEGALRLVGYRYTPLRIEVLNRSDYRLVHAFGQKDFVYDPSLLWRPRRGRTFNRQGYRGPELAAAKRPGEFRIFAIGDSNTLGWAGERDVSWPGRLGQLLAETDPRYTVVNAGVWGYSSFQGVRRFQETLAFQPDLVLFSFGANDGHHVVVPDAAFARSGVRRLRVDRVLHHVRVGQLLIAAMDKARAGHSERLVPRVSRAEYRENLDQIIRIARERHVTLVLLTRPFIGDSPDALWWKNLAPGYNAETIEAGRRHGVPVIDVHGSFRDTRHYFVDESHFTEAGHQVMARLVYDRIRPLLVPGGERF
jgi:lysophospholipase L1-like esterase